MTQTTQTECDCRRGFYLCAGAVRLWSYVNVAYTEALETGKWFPYNDFRQRYDEHMDIREETQ